MTQKQELALPEGGKNALPSGEKLQQELKDLKEEMRSRVDDLLALSTPETDKDVQTVVAFIESFTESETDTANLARFFGKNLKVIITTILKDRESNGENVTKISIAFARLRRISNFEQIITKVLKKE